jgi:hypothetical protein
LDSSLLASSELGLVRRGSNENALRGYNSEAGEKSGNEFHIELRSNWSITEKHSKLFICIIKDDANL